MDEVTIAVLDLAAVEAVERREPAGRQYVRPAFAAQTRGEQTVLVAWIDGVPVGSGEVTADVQRMTVRESSEYLEKDLPARA